MNNKMIKKTLTAMIFMKMMTISNRGQTKYLQIFIIVMMIWAQQLLN